MAPYTYGNRGYMSFHGLDAALKFMRVVAETNPDYQLLLQLDDCDIWIVSWASYDSQYGGDSFMFIPADKQEDVEDILLKEAN